MSQQKKQINEGPLDFLRGAGAEAGRRTANAVSNSAPVRFGRDVANAGLDQSALGNIEKAVAQLANLLAFIDKNAPQQAADPAQQQGAPAAQSRNPNGSVVMKQRAPAPGQKDLELAPMEAVRNVGFSTFMEGVYGDQLDEGIWDFLKGGAAEAGKQVKDKLNAYAAKPSVFKDIYAAGQKASAAGDATKVAQQVEQARAKAKALVNGMVKYAARFQGKEAEVLMQAVKKAGGQYGTRIAELIKKNMDNIPTLTDQVN